MDLASLRSTYHKNRIALAIYEYLTTLDQRLTRVESLENDRGSTEALVLYKDLVNEGDLIQLAFLVANTNLTSHHHFLERFCKTVTRLVKYENQLNES